MLGAEACPLGPSCEISSSGSMVAVRYFCILDRYFQGCGIKDKIKGFIPTSAIQGNPPFYEQFSLGEALSVVL